MSSLRRSSRSKTDQDLSSLNQRRPSWTPSLSEYEGIRLVKSHSRRHARHEDVRSQEWSASFPQSRGYRSVSSLDEVVRRARIVDTEASPEQLKPSVNGPALPESPEDGKRFRSWEINVKDLVGDAVGNVCCRYCIRVPLVDQLVLDEYESNFTRHCSCCVCDIHLPFNKV
jgi:hypothetical protein